MKDRTKYCLGIVAFTLAPLLTATATAEDIYRWVDAEGNVHFGDKPKDPALARDAKPVQLKESYRPEVRTPAEQEQYEREQQSIKRRHDMRQQKQAEKDAKMEEQRRQLQAQRCKAYAADLDRLSSMHLVNGVRTYYYVNGEDGKPVSSDRQREIVAELKAKMTAEGCPSS